jgi:hypothetical protein
VTTGDLNNDGRLDIIASNWGLNSSYRASAPKPLTFMFGQIAQPDVMEIIETEYVGTTLVTRRQFKDLANSMPFLFDRFNSHKAFSEATANDVLGERLPLARRVTATTLASTVFMNLGNKFNAVELPNEAQFAPAFGVSVADFDGDGNEDVFLSQNFSQSSPLCPALDQASGCPGISAAPQWGITMRMGAWTWWSHKTARLQSSIATSEVNPDCASGSRDCLGIQMESALPSDCGSRSALEPRAKSTRVRATGRKTARHR